MSQDKSEIFFYTWRVVTNDMDLPFDDPVREYNFDAEIGRKHRFDAAFPALKIGVEVDGNAWHVKGGGRHMQNKDLEKYNIAASLGWRVFRYSPAMLENNPFESLLLLIDTLKKQATLNRD